MRHVISRYKFSLGADGDAIDSCVEAVVPARALAALAANLRDGAPAADGDDGTGDNGAKSGNYGLRLVHDENLASFVAAACGPSAPADNDADAAEATPSDDAEGGGGNATLRKLLGALSARPKTRSDRAVSDDEWGVVSVYRVLVFEAA